MTANNRGFTLIEFLVAMVILMVGLLGMLQTINLAMEQNTKTLFRNEAYAVANDRMILKRAIGFSISTTSATPPWTFVSRNARGIFKNYSIQEIVSRLTDSDPLGRSQGSKQITVNVAWKNKQQRSTHTVSSVISGF